MAIHFDDLPIGSDFTFVGQPEIYCKISSYTYRLTQRVSPRYSINDHALDRRMVAPWREELETLAANLGAYLEEFLAAPTATGYRFIRNKVAEYYSVSAARKEEAYTHEQERPRVELGIGANSGEGE